MGKNQHTPLYKALFNNLKKQIDAGHYKIGELLPSENELCKEYGTTRPTVRQALSELIKLGYINRKHGKGSIVSEPKNGLGILSIKGSTAGVGKNNFMTKILEKSVKMAWPENFPYELNDVQKQAGCIYFSRLRYVNNAPTVYEETYITDIDLPRFVSHNLEKNSLFETLTKYHNIEIKEGEQKIWAISASQKISKILTLKKNLPVLHMKRSLKTNHNDVIIYSFLYCNTEEYFIQDYF
ncbi:GntR family transcriptional regulator [Sphingobacterium sp. HJSM2_6]|uniref:GntR family transcriptional regulator n=1 Tax=Sphingobacterium sp. HJSM2_6 TaxID=3366264 RepID=UPI003BBF8F8F